MMHFQGTLEKLEISDWPSYVIFYLKIFPTFKKEVFLSKHVCGYFKTPQKYFPYFPLKNKKLKNKN